jgi:hypothetical protein
MLHEGFSHPASPQNNSRPQSTLPQTWLPLAASSAQNRQKLKDCLCSSRKQNPSITPCDHNNHKLQSTGSKTDTAHTSWFPVVLLLVVPLKACKTTLGLPDPVAEGDGEAAESAPGAISMLPVTGAGLLLPLLLLPEDPPTAGLGAGLDGCCAGPDSVTTSGFVVLLLLSRHAVPLTSTRHPALALAKALHAMAPSKLHT